MVTKEGGGKTGETEIKRGSRSDNLGRSNNREERERWKEEETIKINKKRRGRGARKERTNGDRRKGDEKQRDRREEKKESVKGEDRMITGERREPKEKMIVCRWKKGRRWIEIEKEGRRRRRDKEGRRRRRDREE